MPYQTNAAGRTVVLLLVGATVYTLSGPLFWLYRAMRLRASSHSLETPAGR